MFLENEEVIRLTGYRQKAAQRKFLLANGHKFAVNALGQPLVLRSDLIQKLTGTAPTQKMPNFGALNNE